MPHPFVADGDVRPDDEADTPLLPVGSVREQYAHVAKQRCRCNSSYLVTDSRFAPDARTGRHVAILDARCLNSSCDYRHSFRFATAGPMIPGWGRVLAEEIDPQAAGRLFAGLRPPDEAAVRLVAVYLSAAASLASAPCDATVAEMVAGVGLTSASVPLIRRALESTLASFAGIAAELAACAPVAPTGGLG